MMKYGITQNTAVMTVASIGQKIIAFVYFTVIARQIGVQGTGKYFFALSFTTLFVVLVDLGFTTVLIREAARTRERLSEFLSSVLATKLLLGSLTYGIMAVTIGLLDHDTETRRMVYLSGVTMLFDSLHLTFYGVLRALGDLRYESVSMIGSQLLTMILGSLFLLFDLPLLFLILAFTIPSFLNALFAGTILKKKHGLHLSLHLNIPLIISLGTMALPFAVSAILARLYSYADTMILSHRLGVEAVGWYSIPYKMTYAFQFIPLALVAALYPRLSHAFVHDKERLGEIFFSALRYLLICVFPLAVGIGLLANDIVVALYTTSYLPSVIPLQILMVGLLFSFASFPIGALLNACNRQATQTGIIFSALSLNIVLNLLLIPSLGIVGASLAALAGNIILAGVGYAFAARFIVLDHGRLLSLLWRIAASAAVMGLFVWFVNYLSHFSLAILVGGVVYGIMVFGTKIIPVAEVHRAYTRFQKRKSSIDSPL